MWGDQATSWQTLPVESVLAVWEKLDERASLREQLDAEQPNSAASRAVELQLAELPAIAHHLMRCKSSVSNPRIEYKSEFSNLV